MRRGSRRCSSRWIGWHFVASCVLVMTTACPIDIERFPRYGLSAILLPPLPPNQLPPVLQGRMVPL